MKPVFLLVSITLLLFSCNKELQFDRENNQAIKGGVVFDEATHLESVIAKICIAKYSEKYVNNRVYTDSLLPDSIKSGGIIIAGNSLACNWKWDTAWGNLYRKGYGIINRGIGTTRIVDRILFIDSLISCYNPRQLVEYVGTENEHNFWYNAGNRVTTSSPTPLYQNISTQFKKYIETVYAKMPYMRQTYILPQYAPLLVQRNLTVDIDSVRANMIRIINEKKALGWRINYIELPQASSDPALFDAAGLHYKLPSHGYGSWKAAIMPYLLKKGEETIPLPDTTTPPANSYPSVAGPLTARAGADQTLGCNVWCGLIQGTRSTITGAGNYISAFEWEQVSGPAILIMENKNTGTTRVFKPAGVTAYPGGTYVFRVKVTGCATENGKRKNYIAYDDLKLVFN